MARMTQEELQALLQRAGGGRLVHSPVAGNQRVPNPDYDPITDDPEEKYIGGSQPIQQWVSPEGYVIQAIHMPDGSWEVLKNEPPRPDRNQDNRSPSQEALTAAQATKASNENIQEERDNNERSYNSQNPDEFGDAIAETHAQRAARILAKKAAIQQAAVQQQSIASSEAATTAAKDRITVDREQIAAQHTEGEANRGLTQAQLNETIRRNKADEAKPNYLSTADSKNKYVVSGSATGEITSTFNPNYDQVKADAEEKRAEFATLIASRRMTLDEAQAQYTQWFDTNVKGPLMLAQEARAKAEEQRQALDAEERRKQFAADFGLRKATLGESASQRATNAEISLLPYRAGPTESAEMSSAINSLAAGGKVGGPDASAGVNFTAGAFQFAAPDFDKIAKNAAHQVLSGLTDYRPSDQSFATGDYSGVPAANLSGAPSMPAVGAPYQYTPVPLPAPSPGNVQ